MKMRWDAQVDPESFIGVSVLAPCENANKQGAPGIYGFALQTRFRVYADNLAVTPNE